MVHPGIIAASVFGVVVTGVVLYTILKDEISDMFTAFEKPVSSDRNERERQNDRHENKDNYYSGQPSSFSSMFDHYSTDFELRRRRTKSNGNNGDDEEKDFDYDMMTERFRRINETEREIAANEARLAEMERSMKEREEALQQSIREREARLEQAMREAEEQFARQDQERIELLKNHYRLQQQQIEQQRHVAELYQNPFASHERLTDNSMNPKYQSASTLTSNDQDMNITNRSTLPTAAAAAVGVTAAVTSLPEVDPRPANAILRHDLSSNHQLHVNPFEDPSSLLENNSMLSPSSSRRSSVYSGDDEDRHFFADADDRSVIIGCNSDNDDDQDWTEAEIGSISSHDSEDSWGSH
ncbi:hypothetical protein FBU30_000898 [Linnemannia zychae]|nr:hypothetical protein FBU30_000898 [Linnemannia zychae]